MKSRFVKALVTAAAIVAFVPVATAKVDEPGTPGEPNCHGQTIANATSNFGGLGKLAKELGVTVQELQDLVDELCTPPDPDDG